MKKPLSLAEGEYRFAALVWANEPLSSGQLVRLAAFLNEKPISESEAAQIRALLDAAQRREEDP